VQIAPDDFRKQSYAAIEDNINSKYANKASLAISRIIHLDLLTALEQVVQKIGLCICLWDILWTSEGLIGQGDGMVNVNGTYPRCALTVWIADNDTQSSFAWWCSGLLRERSLQHASRTSHQKG
jgi:DNA-directed RNA polymerase subunit E'/Rpb7